LELTGIYREATFSPFQHAENDRLILEATARALTQHGHRVRFLTEEQLASTRPVTPVVFSMCQGPQASRILADEERKGRLIINSARGVQACYRTNLAREAAISDLLAPTRLISTVVTDLGQPRFEDGLAYWLKRGDVHATQEGDVVKVCTPEDYAATLRDFRARGIDEASLQRHIDGVVVKFYGVVGSSFFRWYAEEAFEVRPARFAAARPGIEKLVRRMGLDVYGGDAVIDTDGGIHVIDINDWPSFAYYRREAADVIATHVHRRTVGFLSAALERPRSLRASLLG
jgi:hypothetical protein